MPDRKAAEPPGITQILLPFAEKEYVDMARTCRILGLSWTTVYRLAQSGLIDLIEYRARGWKRIRYQSVVEFCNRLRVSHAIADRRPPLAPHMRHKDEDLLPFPLADTMSAAEALKVLGFERLPTLVKIMEEGHFEAYQVVPGAPWRISRSSFAAYLSKNGNGPPGPRAYRKLPTESRF